MCAHTLTGMQTKCTVIVSRSGKTNGDGDASVLSIGVDHRLASPWGCQHHLQHVRISDIGRRISLHIREMLSRRLYKDKNRS